MLVPLLTEWTVFYICFINSYQINQTPKHWWRSKQLFSVIYIYTQRTHNPQRKDISHSNTTEVSSERMGNGIFAFTWWQHRVPAHVSVSPAHGIQSLVVMYSVLQTQLISLLVLQRGERSKLGAALRQEQWL